MDAASVDIDYSVIAPFLRSLTPDPVLTISEWADENRVLPPSNSEPGRFRTDRTPYIVEIAERLSAQSTAQKVIWMKSAQVAATELGNNLVGYTIDCDPGNMLYILPTDSMAKFVSKTRLQKMIELCSSLSSKIKSNRLRDSGNTILEKEFEGGTLKLVGANAPSGLSSFNAKKVYADEVDRFPQDVAGEGDVISLAEARTITFGDDKIVFLSSTPTLPETSIIAKAFEKTGQRHFHVACPKCGGYQKLLPERLTWETGKYKDVRYKCVHCDQLIEERHKKEMLETGQWIPDYPEREDGIVFGYHINALYSPLGWYSWVSWAKDYDEALTDIVKMKAFVNTKMGLCYSAAGEAPKWENLYNKREEYAFNAPNEHVIFITIGADVQKDRIEFNVVGWGAGKENWDIDYRVIYGDTRTVGSDVWLELDKVINETWTRQDGAVLPMHLMAIDSSDNTAVVLEYCSKWPVSKVIPIKGSEKMSVLVSQSTQAKSIKGVQRIGATKHWNVGVNLIKSELYGLLNLQIIDGKPVPKGYCHFPMYDEHHFKSLTAERLEYVKMKNGTLKQKWVNHYKRNERLDCRVYARAAAFVLGLDNVTEPQWQQLYLESKSLIPDAPKAPPKKKDSRAHDFWDGRNGR